MNFLVNKKAYSLAIIFFNSNDVFVIHNRLNEHLHMEQKVYMKNRRKVKVRNCVKHLSCASIYTVWFNERNIKILVKQIPLKSELSQHLEWKMQIIFDPPFLHCNPSLLLVFLCLFFLFNKYLLCIYFVPGILLWPFANFQ